MKGFGREPEADVPPVIAARLSGLRMAWPTFPAPTILDRYMVAELWGPFTFGLSAFTLIFAATDILAISRLVAEEHAPLGIAIEYFLWQLPQIVITVVPMAMLLGVLLALQRLSGESEITAMQAGGIGLQRAVAPFLIVGFVVSLLALALQDTVVPYANDTATYLREQAIKHVGPFGGGNHTVTTSLPGGARQVTFFGGYDAASQSLLEVTVIKYDAANHPQLIIFAHRARYEPPTWTFTDAQEYSFESGGTIDYSQVPVQHVDVGEKPNQIQQTITNKNREEMSRSELRDVIASGQLSTQETRAFQTSYEEKIARPFASFVFTLIAVPFGLRPPRGGGGVGLGFGLAVAIVFVYFVIASVVSAITTSLPGGYLVSTIGAWTPNALFTGIGAYMLHRAAAGNT